jgi:hypothetical protein
VKELPVTSHRVTEAQAFNMPIVPELRVISEYMSATGTAVVKTSLLATTTVNEVLATTTRATSTFTVNPEYLTLAAYFMSTSTAPLKTLITRLNEELVGTTTPEVVPATSTREQGGVRMMETSDGSVYAEWVGRFEDMPYYYCAAGFPRYSTSTVLQTENELDQEASLALLTEEDKAALLHPVQEVPTDEPCDRRIKLDAQSPILGFEFFPGSTDFVIIELGSGIYLMEVDPRAWQNLQPLVLGEDLHVHVENGAIYVYDGALIYQVILDR